MNFMMQLHRRGLGAAALRVWPLYHTAQARPPDTVLWGGFRPAVMGCRPSRGLPSCASGQCRKTAGRTVHDMKTTNTMNANIPNQMRKEVYRRDGFRCALCDSTDGLQIHHVKPRGRGGADHPMNLITLCWRCHAAAHGNMVDASCYANVDPMKMRKMTPQQRIKAVMDEIELACVEYVSDYYAERGEIWYPWEG